MRHRVDLIANPPDFWLPAGPGVATIPTATPFDGRRRNRPS
jgi:hypothetical protein